MSATLVLTHSEQELLTNGDDREEETEDVAREAELYVFDNCSKGLGIKICGGCSLNGEELYGIFIKRVLPGGLADLEGGLQKGDQILEVNRESLEGVTNERAVAILRQASASNHVEMVVARDEAARMEFTEIVERNNGFSFPCTPVPTDLAQQGAESLRRSSSVTEERHPSPTAMLQPAAESQPMPYSQQEQEQVNQLETTLQPQAGTAPMVNGGATPKNPQAFRGFIPSIASTPNARESTGSASSGSRFSSLPPMEPSPVVGAQSANNMSAGSVFDSNSLSRLPKSRNMSQSRKLSLDPYVRLKVDKLNSALRYLGLDPSPEQEQEIRSRLNIDASGTVHYGDFVDVARDIFRLQLEEKNIGAGAMLFAANDFTDIVEPPAFGAEGTGDQSPLQRENEDLRQENRQLEVLLREKEEEILKIRKEAQGAIHEQRTLLSKVHLAAQAQKAARDMEHDYEEVVHLLEGEIAQLKVQLRKQGETDPVMQRRLAVLTCQLRKAESEKETFKVTTEKLLQFAEVVHETLGDSTSLPPSRPLSSSGGEAARGSKPPGLHGKHKTQSSKAIAAEAKEVVKSVRSMIDLQPLPFGWEETYTSDGMKYYINHLNQVTTWTHPLSNVTHLPTVHDDKKSKGGGELKPPGATG